MANSTPDTAEAKIEEILDELQWFDLQSDDGSTDYGYARKERIRQQLKGLLVDAKVEELENLSMESKYNDDGILIPIEDRVSALLQTRQEEVSNGE